MSEISLGFGSPAPARREPRRLGWLASQHLLLALDRGRPRTFLGFLDGTRLHRAGLSNARRALEVLETASAERAALAPQPLSHNEVVDLLRAQTVGRFAYLAREGVPDVVTVNYRWQDDTALIRSGPGPKLHAARREELVALEVEDLDEHGHTGVSAVVVGRAMIADPQTAGLDADAWPEGAHRHLIRITPTRLEGRRIG
jgi:hypothetical protein